MLYINMEGTIVDTSQPEIPRAVRPNPYNYDNLEFAKRDKAIKDMEKDFPNIPFKWLEWLYDTVENKPKDEVEEIIKSGAWEKQINLERMKGGVLKNAEVIPPTFTYAIDCSDSSNN